MPPKKNTDGRKWLYHEDCPKGKIFDKPDLDEMAEAGWVRSPADLNLPQVEEEAEELTEEKVKGFRPEDMVAHVKGMGFAVMTPDELVAEVGKLVDSLPAVTPLTVADFSDIDIAQAFTDRKLSISDDGVVSSLSDSGNSLVVGNIVPLAGFKTSESTPAPTLSDRFNEAPKSLTKEEHIALGKELGLTLRKTWSEPVMIEKITAKLNEAG